MEGREALDDLIETGVPVDAQLTAELLNTIFTVQANVSIADVTQTIQRIVTLEAFGGRDSEIVEVTIEPGQAQVTVSVERREDAHEVAVNIVTTGTPPEGYWLSAIQVEPAAVTLAGEAKLLDTLGGYVDTLPVDVSKVYGTQEIGVPLNVPAKVQVLDEMDTSVEQVVVSLQVEALIWPLKRMIGCAFPHRYRPGYPDRRTQANLPAALTIVGGDYGDGQTFELNPGQEIQLALAAEPQPNSP